MKMPLKSNKNPYRDCEIVTCVTTFLGQDVTLNAGLKLRGDDPLVERYHGVFAEGDLLPHELAQLAAEQIPLDSPVYQDERILIGQGVTPAPHRQVVCLVDTFVPLPFAPGSPGARDGGPPAPYGTGLRRGKVYDVGDPVVRANPNLFEFGRRDCTLADVERLTAEDANPAA